MILHIDDLRLSPYTFSVFCALREKNVQFELSLASFQQGRSLPGAFQGLTFTDLIPAWEEGDFVLSESMAILEYIEEKFPKPSLFPKNQQDRARARMLLSWYRCGMIALRSERSSETVFYPGQFRDLPKLSPAALDEVKELCTCLESFLKPGREFLFQEWSIADHETALMLQRLISNADPISPRLKEYALKIWTRPSAQEFIQAKRPPYQSFYR